MAFTLGQLTAWSIFIGARARAIVATVGVALAAGAGTFVAAVVVMVVVLWANPLLLNPEKGLLFENPFSGVVCIFGKLMALPVCRFLSMTWNAQRNLSWQMVASFHPL